MCSGDGAMHAAAQNGDELSFEALLKAGADVSQLGRSD